MPGLNRKGPEGEGPMTGRGQGRCRKPENTDENYGESREMTGRGRGRRLRFRGESGFGRGRGQGRGRW